MSAMNEQSSLSNTTTEQAEEYHVVFLENDVVVYMESDEITITL